MLYKEADARCGRLATVGQWVPLVERVVGRTSYNWTTASRGATYHFRVIAYYHAPPPGEQRDVGDQLTGVPRPVASIPSPVVTFHTGGTGGDLFSRIGAHGGSVLSWLGRLAYWRVK